MIAYKIGEGTLGGLQYTQSAKHVGQDEVVMLVSTRRLASVWRWNVFEATNIPTKRRGKLARLPICLDATCTKAIAVSDETMVMRFVILMKTSPRSFHDRDLNCVDVRVDT